MTERALLWIFFFFSSRRRHTRCGRDWSSDVCSSDLTPDGFTIKIGVVFITPEFAAIASSFQHPPSVRCARMYQLVLFEVTVFVLFNAVTSSKTEVPSAVVCQKYLIPSGGVCSYVKSFSPQIGSVTVIEPEGVAGFTQLKDTLPLNTRSEEHTSELQSR